MVSQRCFYQSRSFERELEGFGVISPSDMRRLEFDIMLGHGETIEGTGGLKQVRCGLGGFAGKSCGWQVVFADYPGCQITVLLIKFPDKIKRRLNKKEKEELRESKQQLDEEIKRKFGDT
jgi:hypothetical protein